MKIIIIMDTHSFKLKLLDDVLQRISYDRTSQRVDSIVFYHQGMYDPVFLAHLRKNFPGVNIDYTGRRIPVRPGRQSDWRHVIRDQARSAPDTGYILTVVISERFNVISYNLAHSGVLTNIAMARVISPAVSDSLPFTRLDSETRNYFSDASYPYSSIHSYKD